MADFEDIIEVNQLLKEAQESDSDIRDKVREVHHFLDKPDGQWEPNIVSNMNDRPMYTFDQCNDIVDGISGDIDESEFGIKVRPAGGEASLDTAKVYDGLIRNIQALSNAQDIYDESSRDMVAAGFHAWRVNQRWGSNDAFDQDLFIDKIANPVDSVWFEPTSIERTRADSNYCFVLSALSKSAYKDKYPKGSAKSIGTDDQSEVYSHKPDSIIIGEILYKTEVDREIVEMTNGAVYVDDDKFKKIVDELALAGITEKRRRTRKSVEVKTRIFDGGGWLTEIQDTVFSLLPIIPEYGNFKISENKPIYWGVISKKMDAQRVLNYAESRKIEEGALSPRPKTWLTREQAENDTATLQTQNTNPNPIQTYTHVDNQPPPFQTSAPTVNPGLTEISNAMISDLRRDQMQSQGQPVGLRSGVAVELEQNSADTKNIKYFSAHKTAICHTAAVLIDAIPKVYDTARMVRVLGEDGTSDMVQLFDRVQDQQTGEIIEINDLSKGVYDATCIVGPAFQSKQAETVAAFNELAQIDPSIMQTGRDVWLRNITAPGMDIVADRIRAQMIQAGQIPESEWTEDEKAQIQAAQQQAQGQEPAPDALMVAAQAEVMKAQNQQADIQLKAQQNQETNALEGQRIQLGLMEVQNKQAELQFKAESKGADVQQKQLDSFMAQQAQQFDNMTSAVDAMKTLAEAFGIDAIGGAAPATLIQQAGELVDQTQDDIT